METVLHGQNLAINVPQFPRFAFITKLIYRHSNSHLYGKLMSRYHLCYQIDLGIVYGRWETARAGRIEVGTPQT